MVVGRPLAMACILAALALAPACQPIYGSKPDKLAKPSPKKRPPEAPIVAVEIKYIEECTASFRDDPKRVLQEKAISNKLTEDGDAAIQASTKAKEPAASASAVKEGIDKYSNALRKDPYNAEATLKLAVAYDMVYRKGCAIAMLKRLATLSSNPKVSPNANRIIDSITDNGQLFKGYRKEAVAAAGR